MQGAGAAVEGGGAVMKAVTKTRSPVANKGAKLPRPKVMLKARSETTPRASTEAALMACLGAKGFSIDTLNQ